MFFSYPQPWSLFCIDFVWISFTEPACQAQCPRNPWLRPKLSSGTSWVCRCVFFVCGFVLCLYVCSVSVCAYVRVSKIYTDNEHLQGAVRLTLSTARKNYQWVERLDGVLLSKQCLHSPIVFCCALVGIRIPVIFNIIFLATGCLLKLCHRTMLCLVWVPHLVEKPTEFDIYIKNTLVYCICCL